jgi:hypothetical protein
MAHEESKCWVFGQLENIGKGMVTVEGPRGLHEVAVAIDQMRSRFLWVLAFGAENVTPTNQML